MIKVLITGGSGFIGTNLIDYYITIGYQVYNIDIVKPRKIEHSQFWYNVDLLDQDTLTSTIKEILPNLIFHMAARTDLKGNNINNYSANTIGLKNLIYAMNKIDSINFVVFTSSMLVCAPGYKPKNNFDYSPQNPYGESKVIGENLVRNSNFKFPWVIVRPTSIWGPWFGEPYYNFFELILNNRFYKTNSFKIKRKTFGYVYNLIVYLDHLVHDNNLHKNDIVYFGDFELSITEFAHSIEKNKLSNSKIKSVPFWLYQSGAIFGDFLNLFKIKFPLTSFRLNNLTSENIILNNRDSIESLNNKYKSFDDGINETIIWYLKYKDKK